MVKYEVLDPQFTPGLNAIWVAPQMGHDATELMVQPVTPVLSAASEQLCGMFPLFPPASEIVTPPTELISIL